MAGRKWHSPAGFSQRAKLYQVVSRAWRTATMCAANRSLSITAYHTPSDQVRRAANLGSALSGKRTCGASVGGTWWIRQCCTLRGNRQRSEKAPSGYRHFQRCASGACGAEKGREGCRVQSKIILFCCTVIQTGSAASWGCRVQRAQEPSSISICTPFQHWECR